MPGILPFLHRWFRSTAQLVAVMVLLCWPNPKLFSQNPSFKASIDIKEAYVGIPFEVTFTLTDAEGQRFNAPPFREFKQQGLVSESRGVSIVNGKSSSRQTWSYTLVPSKPGTFSIGSASVTAAGRTFNSPPITVKVASAPAASNLAPPGQNDQVFITASLSTPKAFPGQQVTWRLTLFTRVAIEGADLIALPDFEGFYSREKRRFDTRTQYQTIRGKKYAVKTLHEEALFAQSSGELTIGAAQIRVGLEQPGPQGFLFGTKPVTLTAPPITLSVANLPDPAPASFTGGVGKYEWEVNADTSRLSTDDALALTVTIKGNGDTRRFAAPKLQVPATCEIFDPRILEEEEYESEQEILHTKKLEYVILPKEPGNQEIIPILTYYDTDSNRYCSIQAAPIRFEVTAGKNYQPTATPLPTIQTPPQTSFWDKAKRLLTHPILWTCLALTMLAFGIFLLVKKRKKTSPQPPQTTTSPIQKVANTTTNQPQRFFDISNLQHVAAPETFYNELLKSLQTYIAARLDISPAQLSHAELRNKLAERQVTPIRAQAFLSILQACEQAVFSGHRDPSKMESDWRTAQVIVQELEKEIH